MGTEDNVAMMMMMVECLLFILLNHNLMHTLVMIFTHLLQLSYADFENEKTSQVEGVHLRFWTWL